MLRNSEEEKHYFTFAKKGFVCSGGNENRIKEKVRGKWVQAKGSF